MSGASVVNEGRAGASRGSGEARGRQAAKPSQIPAKGWKDILYRTYTEVANDRVTLVAAGVTFYLLLALAPTLAAFVSLYGLFLDPGEIAGQAAALSGVLPGGATDILNEQLARLAEADGGTLGFAFALSLGLALWSANAGMKSLFEAMNVAYDETEDRGFVRLTLVTLAFTIGTLGSVIGLIVFNAAFTTFREALGLTLPGWIVNTLTAALALAALIVFMSLLYRFGPSRARPQWTWITPGALFAGVMIVLVSVAFTFYVSNFGTYNETYGSLGAIVGFLTWLWLVMIVLIMGAEINSEMEHQTAVDTTTGAPRPMGRREAVKADTMGPTFEEKRREADADGSGPPRRDGSDPRSGSSASGQTSPAAPRSENQKLASAALLIGMLGVALASRR